MKFRLFQTLLVATTIVTWASPLQAFTTVNKTHCLLSVFTQQPEDPNLKYHEWVNAGATSKSFTYNGQVYLCAAGSQCPYPGYSTSTPTYCCSLPVNGQQIVTYSQGMLIMGGDCITTPK